LGGIREGHVRQEEEKEEERWQKEMMTRFITSFDNRLWDITSTVSTKTVLGSAATTTETVPNGTPTTMVSTPTATTITKSTQIPLLPLQWVL
jgi:hypothetical protein